MARFRLLHYSQFGPLRTLLDGASAYYVDATNGNDANKGTSPSKAWQTIAKVNAETFNPDDNILFKKGETWTAQLTTPSSGTDGHNIIFGAYGSGTDPTIAPSSGDNAIRFSGVSYVTVKDFILDGTNIDEHVIQLLSNSHHNKIQDSEVKNGALHSGINVFDGDYNEFLRLIIHDNGNDGSDHGLYIETAYNLVEDCEVYNNFANGINIYAENGGLPYYDEANYNIVRYCKVYDHTAAVGGTGILLSCGIDNLAHHNLIWDNRVGIQLAFGSESKIYSNTIYSVDDYGLRVSDTFTDGLVKNNISRSSGVNDFLDEGADTVASNNLTADPKFTNAGADNFHLESDSPARDAGADLGFTRDYDNVAVPQETNPAIGAYEYVA